MSKLYYTISCLLFIVSIVASATAHAWGERGHDVVTRVAVQQLRNLVDDDARLVTPFSSRDHFLSHLSNVPDIVWRSESVSEKIHQQNHYTHFLTLENAYKGRPSVLEFETSFTAFAARSKTPLTETGSAAWRVAQIHQLMVESLIRVSEHDNTEKKIVAINQALVYAGLMSHFVADLANPHHTTKNYDGQLSDATGMHAYFESDIVRELDLSLATIVSQRLDNETVSSQLLTDYDANQRDMILEDPLLLTLALSLDSYAALETLIQLDRDHALLEKSKNAEEAALRRPAKQVASKFSDFAEERLALASSVLSHLWLLAWQQAGSPDMSAYHSYDYPVAPKFITPDYVRQVKESR